jgi:hypothetical protein
MNDPTPKVEGGSSGRVGEAGGDDRPRVDGAALGGADLGYAALILALTAAMWLPRLRTPIDLSWDASVYYILGTSLAEGRGYRLLNEPGEVRAIQYPPLLPTVVAAYQKALGTNDPLVVGWWLARSYQLVTALYLVSVYALARRFVTPPWAFIITLITILHRNTFTFSETLFTEVPFALTSVLFLLIARPGARWRAECAAGLLGVASFLLRTAGLALLAAWVAEALLDRRWGRAAVRGVVALVPVLTWQAYIAGVRSGPEYRAPAYPYQRAAYQYSNVSYAENAALVDPFVPERGRATPRRLAGRIYRNILPMPDYLGEAVMWRWDMKALRYPWLPSPPGIGFRLITLTTLVIGYLALAGFAWFLVEREWLIPAYFAASLGLICLTPWPTSVNRYLIPLTPLMTLAIIRLLTSFRDYSLRRWSGGWRYVGPACLVALAAVIVGRNVWGNVDFYDSLIKECRKGLVREQPSLVYNRHEWGGTDDCLAWLKDHARPGEVVAMTAPHWAYLRTGLKSVLPPMVADPDEAQRLLDSVPVDYVISDHVYFEIVKRYALPAILAHPQSWELVYSPDEHTQLYRRRRP